MMMARILEYLGFGAEDMDLRKECVLECVLYIYSTVFGQEMEPQDVLYKIQTGSIREQSVLLKLNRFFEPKNVRLDHITLFRIKMNYGTIKDVADLIERLVDEEEKKLAFRPAFSIGDQSITMTDTPYSRGELLRYTQTYEDGSDNNIAISHPMYNLFDEISDQSITISRASTSVSRMLSEKLGGSSLKAYRSQFDVSSYALSPNGFSDTYLKSPRLALSANTFSDSLLKSPRSTFAHCKTPRNEFLKSKSLVESKRKNGLQRTFSFSKKRSLSHRLRPAFVPNATWVESGENESTISTKTPSQKMENDFTISTKLPSPRVDTPRPPFQKKRNPETGI